MAKFGCLLGHLCGITELTFPLLSEATIVTSTVDLPPTIPNMVPIVLKLAIWSLFGAVATILASATANGLAVESRPAPFTPIPSATPHSDSAKASATTDRYLSTSAGAHGFSTSVTSIASTNISFLPSAGHTPSTGELTWSVTELAVLRPTTTSGTLLRAHAHADVSISTVSIASAGDSTARIDADQSHLASRIAHCHGCAHITTSVVFRLT